MTILKTVKRNCNRDKQIDLPPATNVRIGTEMFQRLSSSSIRVIWFSVFIPIFFVKLKFTEHTHTQKKRGRKRDALEAAVEVTSTAA